MTKNQILNIVTVLLFTASTIHPKITAIFVDVTALFQTNSFKASGYIGKIDAIRYIASAGHKPNEETLFKTLQGLKAKSTVVTYNNNLAMPLIFSDWLAAVESNTKLKEMIQKYFSSRNISDIEKKVLFAIVSMMMTPEHLANTQEINTKIKQLLEKLKAQKIKLYLTGNWAHIASLRSMFPEIFALFSGVYISGDLHLIKPDSNFYTTVLTKANITAEQALWIETEPKFVSAAQSIHMNVASYADKNFEFLTQSLRKFGITV